MKALVNNLVFYWKLYVHLLGYNLQSRLAYRWEFFLSVISVMTELTVRLVFLSVIYQYIPTLAGWTYPQMLFLFATGFTIEALAWFTWRGSLMKIHLSIQDGSYDFLITKPVSLLFITSMRRMDLEDAARIILAVGLVGYATHLQGFAPHLGQVLMWCVSLCLAEMVYFSFALLLKTTSFWTTQTSEINYILYSSDRLNQYPTQIYTGFVHFAFTYIIPITFITTIPAQLINGKTGLLSLFGLLVFTIAIFLIARSFFYYAVRSYSSASS